MEKIYKYIEDHATPQGEALDWIEKQTHIRTNHARMLSGHLQGELMRILGKWMSLYGEAVYEGKPYGATTQNAKNFVLKGDGYLYFFVHDLGRNGNVNVTKDGKYSGYLAFNRVPDAIESIEWMDNGEQLSFVQDGESFSFNATGYPYGMSTCVRVAKAKISK